MELLAKWLNDTAVNDDFGELARKQSESKFIGLEPVYLQSGRARVYE